MRLFPLCVGAPRLAGMLVLSLAAAAGASTAASAQAAGVPAGWVVRTDAASVGHAAAERVQFVTMKPGFHVTTGPAAILYDSTLRASGDWRLETTIHLFDPGARAEGFGVFFGGQNLASAAPRYGYALFRRDGKVMIKARDGASTRTVRDWATNSAIPLWRGGPAGSSVKYPIVVEAKGDRVSVWIGATQVLDAPRSELPTDGVVGLRINHSLNVHVEKLTVSALARR